MLRYVGFALLLTGCARYRQPMGLAPAAQTGGYVNVSVRVDSLRLLDPARNRLIPVATYGPAGEVRGRKLRIALLNHGYGGRNTEYSFLARALVAHGYFVASIQHELPGDEPIANTGKLVETRRPNWQRGVESMRFVLRELHRIHPSLSHRHTLLVGHSNGGDMVMLFAQQYAELVGEVITLDNRRMPFPRSARPRLLSLRSGDQQADTGVLPSPAEQARWNMQVVTMPATRHNDMWDGATEERKQEMVALISRFLANGKPWFRRSGPALHNRP
ncbi:alpha/beta hydrolase [Hymenobacter weizhouensis]|uniref:alpha/beta hydrolase n=1 Tax=Hymenobacter sp. YIM 151500-1 TaxID=2987689 RepID=UPI002225FCCE|nr:alpha/beta hydrolase [Hymenobacter sp. YIM 151500-1]UYZ63770.1 alpha/beta hydrolase [Hymenobacter sp. YIM 151500-1]